MATAAQIQAEAAALPQTQDALDALLVKYSPGELAAAFPGYDQSDIDKARAAAEQREFINWQMQQPAPAGQGTIGDVFAAQGITDPKNDPRVLAQAQEQIDRAARREDMFAQAGVAAPDVRPWSDAPVPTGGAGGGGTTSRPPATGGGTTSRPPATGGRAGEPGGSLGAGTAGLPSGGAAPASGNRIQSIQQWYNANVGRTDPQAQTDLNRFLATSGFTAREINAALPQWTLPDLQNAMRTAIGEVAQQTPFAPVAAQPMQPLAQPYTSIASRLPGGADARAQEIQNWYAANAGRTDPQAQPDLERFLASGYTAQEINSALPQFDVPFLTSGISSARQQNPDAAFQSQLARYQSIAPGAQFTGTASPYGLIMDQMQPFTNPYADTLANVALGGYNPGVYNVLLDEKVDPNTGIAVPVNDGGTGGPGDDGPGPGDTSGTPGASGSTNADGTTSAGGCVDPNVMVLLATGASIRAGDIKVGDVLHTLHEDTLAYGDYPVEFVSIITQPKVEITFHDGQKIIVSTTHKFLTDKNEWLEVQQMEIGQPIKTQHGSKTLASVTDVGDGPVVKMTVTDAHTYIADGLVSHNKYNGGLVTEIFGADPAGPDEGQIDIQRGEYVIKKSSVKKYGQGLLDMINEGKIPAKKIKSLLD